jgi:hydroxypyruvate isomerase
MHRRQFLAAATATAAISGLPSLAQAPAAARKGKFKQGCFKTNFDPKWTMEQCAKAAAEIGVKGFDLVGPNDWPLLKKYGLEASMAGAGPVDFENGMIHPEVHEAVEAKMHPYIDQVAAGGCKNIISVGGKKKGMGYEEAAANAVKFLNKIKSHLEDKQVTLCLEMMNSKYEKDARLGRIDQVCDHWKWGVNVMKQVNSPNCRMLFDIYHVGTADGDVIANLKEDYQYISHFHTGGVPGRRELDETQELNYRLIAETIADLGFTGFVTHEYQPTPGKDPIESLKKCFGIMNV